MIENTIFPPHELADEYGLLALGGNYSPDLLLVAYAHGIFPWPSDELPLAWYSPDPRMLLAPAEFHCSRSLSRLLRKNTFRCTFDTAFSEVVEACATVDRNGEGEGGGDGGTWISEELHQGFLDLHAHGIAHSVEVWRQDELVGGLYGLSLGEMFCGESMFHRESNASKVAVAALVERALDWQFLFIDCQLYSEHLASLGAREWPRDEFLEVLKTALQRPSRIGPWADPAGPSLIQL